MIVGTPAGDNTIYLSDTYRNSKTGLKLLLLSVTVRKSLSLVFILSRGVVKQIECRRTKIEGENAKA